MIPRRFAPVAFGFLLSGFMSFLVSGISIYRAEGFSDAFMHAWMGGWIPSWAVAFPAVLVVAPLARRIVDRLVRS